jgi:hypothetical protein
MRRITRVSAACTGLLLAASTARAAAPAFTSAPAAVRAGDAVKISFAVDAPTDVAVYVQDAEGRIVRHLAGGRLGDNAPEPLQRGTLAQALTWDGRADDGQPAGPGPFRVRVGLGLTASYAGHAFAATNRVGPNKVENILGLTVAPDGRLYALDACNGMVWGGNTRVLVFRRDGAYEQTIKPFPSTLTADKGRAAGAFTNAFGAFNPLIQNVQGLTFYPTEAMPHQPAVTADGQVYLAMRNQRIAVLDRSGGIPAESFTGPQIAADASFGGYPALVACADGKSLLVTGLNAGGGKGGNAIHRVRLPERAGAEPWFGEPAAAGSDNAHLRDVRSLALDGQGHVIVADCGNDRVLVLNERDRSVAASVPIKAPLWAAADGRTGALYVLVNVLGTNELVKFSGWEKPAEVARVMLKPAPGKNQSWRLALDATAAPTVVWAALGSRLLRCEDADGKLAEPVSADCYAAELYWRPAADPTRREVLCRKGGEPGYGAWIEILEESSGKIRAFGKSAIAGKEGRSHRLGPDGGIYIQDHAGQAGGILRLDRDANPRPFEATRNDPFLQGRLPAGPTGTTMWERDFSVDRKGEIYVRACGPEYHGLMTVHNYDTNGYLKKIVLQTVSDGMYGPRLDTRGNLYIMDATKAPGQPYPPEFAASLAAFPAARDGIDWIYGSVIKFTPAGGAIWFSGTQASPVTFEGFGSGTSIAGLRTTGGALVGTIARPPAAINFPGLRLQAAETRKLTFRLRNESAGTQARFSFHRLRESYTDSCGPGFSLTVPIQPDSDFTEYTLDLSGQKEWRDIVHKFTLFPTLADKGAFRLDWIRFGEAGGPATNAWGAPLAWNFDAEDTRETKLPATLAKEKVGAYGRAGGAELQGACWWKAGFSPVGDLGVHNGCHCTGSDFDVDDFGRVFAPDTGRFRVGVLDANGNELLSFGGYGNQDCCGPESYVVDPAGRFLRPRRADDPKGLTSPSAQPEIGFAWIIGLAVTDRYAYISDVVNKRVLRVRLGYAAEETCEVK